MKGDVGNKIVGKQVQMYLCNKLIFVLPLKPYYNYKNVILSNQDRIFLLLKVQASLQAEKQQ